MRRRPILLLVFTLCLAPFALAGSKKLKPVPAAGQRVLHAKKDTLIVESKNGIKAEAMGNISGDVVEMNIGIENDTKSDLPVEQERFFVVNAYDRTLYRLPDYEIRATLAWAENQPPPPPPPPRHYYTLEMDTYGTYTLQYEGDGYYSADGFSQTYGTIQKHYDRDPAETLGYIVGAAIGQAIQHHKYRKAIETMDKSYFRNTTVAPGQYTVGKLLFEARLVSARAPFKLILFVGNTEFQFVFQK